MQINYLDLFSGVGGFTRGLLDAGFTFGWHGFSEVDKHAVKLYQGLYPDAEAMGDITNISTDEIVRLSRGIGGINLITFGFPCQDLSKWQLLNTKWFLPQNRERIYFVGHLRKQQLFGREIFPVGETDEIHNKQKQDGKAIQHPAQCLKAGDYAKWNGNFVAYQKTHSKCITQHTNEIDTLQSARLDKVPAVLVGTWRTFKDEPNFRPMRTSEDCPCIPARQRQDGSGQPVIAVLTPDRPEKRQNGRRFKAEGEPMFTLTGQDRHGVMIIDHQGRKNNEYKPANHCPTLRSESHGNQPCVVGVRGSMQENAGTMYNCSTSLTSAMGMGGGQIPIVNRIRRLTPLECFRLQFGMRNADIMIAKAKELNISDTQLYKMAGNAVSSPVVQCIAERLIKAEVSHETA